MTFYWWSHWFWITVLYNVCLLVTAVNTYPSRDVTTESNQNDQSNKAITKIYQTTRTYFGSSFIDHSSIEKKFFTSISTGRPVDFLRNEDEDIVTDENLKNNDNSQESIEDEEFTSQQVESVVTTENEFKRSIGVNNDSAQNISTQMSQQTNANNDSFALSQIKKIFNSGNHKKEELSNYTNSSFKQGTNFTTSQNSSTLVSQNTDKSTAVTLITPVTNKSQNSFDLFNSITNVPVNHDSHVLMVDATPPTADIASLQKVPFTLENVNKEDELRRAESEHRTRKPKVLSAEYKQINRVINYSIDSKSLLTRSASTARNMFDNVEDNNIASEALSVQRTYFLDASAISAICLTVFGVCCTVGTIAIVLYRRRFLNKPQALSEPDSSVYIDDSTMRVSDNSDEMYSLDNDSFLNSLEAMTIQNYWTDTVKHTKL